MNRNDKLIGDCWNYIYEVICCNDYHSEQDVDEEFLTDGGNLGKSLREMLAEKIKEGVFLLSEEMKDEEDKEDIEFFRKQIKRGEKLLERLDLQKQLKEAKSYLKIGE